MRNKKPNTITVLDYSAKNNLKVIEVYRLIDSGKLKTTKQGKKEVILL